VKKQYPTSFIPVRDYLENKIKDVEEKLCLRLQAMQIAIDKQESANNIRFNNTNEWREESKDRMSTYLSKGEYEVRHQLTETRIEALQKIVYMALGGLLILEFLFKFLIK
jgi:hypothetical protein